MRQETHRSSLVPVLAWSLCALCVLIWLATLALFVASTDPERDVAELVVSGLVLGYALVGALVAVREPRNAVGWLLLGIALTYGISGVVDVYVLDLGRPLIVGVTWFEKVVGDVWVLLAAFVLPLVFPDGRPLSRRWGRVLWLGVAIYVGSLVESTFTAGPLDEDSVPIRNPLGLTGLAGSVVEAIGTVSDVLFVVAAGLVVVAVTLRLRRSHGRQRQQVKWFGYVAGLALGGLMLSSIQPITEALAGSSGAPRWTGVVAGVGWVGAALLMIIGIPVAVAIAILRHHLYDIDLVIKRTLVYASLTLILGCVYLGSVLGLRLLLGPLAGDSDLAVAASTLAVAALFRPVRDRIQRVVDRRFYRSKYDAARTVESFAGRLRHEVDLQAVSTDLQVVVRDTVHPAHVSLWLRGTT